MNGDPLHLLAVANVRGQVDQLVQLLEDREGLGFDSVALIGDLTSGGGTGNREYRDVFQAVGRAGVPAFWVPGPGDAPVQTYLREAHNIEVVFPELHGVHGTFAMGRHFLVAGMGGEIVDDPDAERDEQSRLRYPGWEVEYRLKAVREFDEHQKAFLFATPPAHKGLREPGSEVLAELINTYRPRVVITGGDEARSEQLGKALIVAPGNLGSGEYATVDVRERTVTPHGAAAAR